MDAIIHLGGARSFWDHYHTLRDANVYSTRELIRLAAPRQVPIHYISTMGVLPRQEVDAIAAPASSAARYISPVDGTNGYVATRWASERMLERAGEVLGVPSTIYRFVPGPHIRKPPNWCEYPPLRANCLFSRTSSALLT